MNGHRTESHGMSMPGMSGATMQATTQATMQATTQATMQATKQATMQATVLGTTQATVRGTMQATTQTTTETLVRGTTQTRVPTEEPFEDCIGEEFGNVSGSFSDSVLSEVRGMPGIGEGRALSVAKPSAAEVLTAAAIHRLCQPLTALQCTLELGLDRIEDQSSLRGTMVDSLRECVRTIAMLMVFRNLSDLPSQYGAVSAIDIAPEMMARGLRCERSVTGWDAQVLANPAALELICRSIQHVVESCGGDRQGYACIQFESRAGHAAYGEEQQGWLCVRWSVGDAGSLAEGDAARWQRETALMHPFNARDFDFAGGALPALAIANTLTEAMGGVLVAGERELELHLPMIPMMPMIGLANTGVASHGVARLGRRAIQVGERLPEEKVGARFSGLDRYPV